MHRLLFEKTGNAVWISHLDLMRVFQRAFKRAGLPLTHTHGYNPRPSVSIALPLSVGVESICELLDFELDGESTTCTDMRDRLNGALIEGVRVREVYDTGRKLKELSYLHCAVTFEYDSSITEDAERKIGDLFKQTELIVPKKGKNGVQDQNIIPMIRSLEIKRAGEQELLIDCIICCQNPTLNPAQLTAAVKMYLPEMSPDFSCCKRLEILDSNGNVFR